MLKILLTHKLRLLAASLFVLLFVLVRVFEDHLFYDPFLNYYKSNFNDLPLPIYNPFCLFMGLLFRYGLNTVISLGLIYVLFSDIEIINSSHICLIVYSCFLFSKS